LPVTVGLYAGWELDVRLPVTNVKLLIKCCDKEQKLNNGRQAGTDAGICTKVDCTSVKPNLHKTQC
jgi:hypothetical protein